jgi:hypothetical protein
VTHTRRAKGQEEEIQVQFELAAPNAGPRADEVRRGEGKSRAAGRNHQEVPRDYGGQRVKVNSTFTATPVWLTLGVFSLNHFVDVQRDHALAKKK